jgi:hypothetical protein
VWRHEVWYKLVTFSGELAGLSETSVTICRITGRHIPEDGSDDCAVRRVPILGAFAKLRKVTISFVVSVRLSPWNNWAPTGRIFVKFDI